LCSCYAWELGNKPEEGLCVAVIIKNQVDHQKGIKGGCWDSANLVSISFEKTKTSAYDATYKLTSTVFFNATLSESAGEIDFSGSLTTLKEAYKNLPQLMNVQTHVNVIGTLIEDCETEVRSRIEERNIKKTKEIVDTSRYSPVMGKPNIEGAKKLQQTFKHN